MSKLKNGAKELFGIAKDLAKGKDISVPDGVFKERYGICQSCPKLSSLGFCGECGCAMALKCKVATSKCPIDKWQAWEPK